MGCQETGATGESCSDSAGGPGGRLKVAVKIIDCQDLHINDATLLTSNGEA